MSSLEQFIDKQLMRGRAYFSLEDAQAALGADSKALVASAARLRRKHRLANPRRGFYLILRPEDRAAGAPDPLRWIDPLMKYLRVDYRISLLRAAAHHGASHQAAMVFQVMAPKQLRSFELGRHRVEFVYQEPAAFEKLNKPEGLGQIKSEEGFAKVAGVELTLLDCVRYFHKATGIQGVAQIVHDLGAKVDPIRLSGAAANYANVAVRRLGYLLECAGHGSQSDALESLAKRAKSFKLLNPAVEPLPGVPAGEVEKDARWMLLINESVELDF